MILSELSKEDINEITCLVFGDDQTQKEQADLIFVFGGTNPGIWEAAYQAYSDGIAERILIAGGLSPNGRKHFAWDLGDIPESVGIKHKLVELGVPADNILCEVNSSNSYENVVFSEAAYDLSNMRNIAVVCRSYSAGRQCRTIDKQLGGSVRITPFTFEAKQHPDEAPISRHNWLKSELSYKLVIGEFLKILKYGSYGHLTEASINSGRLIDYAKLQV
ncbi:hypothetical protein CS022_19000 [Veronia nyctiphanis]|uniref:DUF218 domain-containing protein n=1 Tax=Veronia nyctiphanis TaxID=1278244 RepID=A0A4Q0YM07_9GAMM|nr:YdcF family protein [Veronia nyctiphanis]RXJ71857.1 hypothetical protein CS022_19000 [Veronia nyctiphanis]